MAFRFTSLIAVLLVFTCVGAQAGISIQDDSGATLRLPAPARRIVSLAPHLTENLFAAGAGARVVGVVDYSDHPEAAKQIAGVGDYSLPNLETIVALRPDLVVAWRGGNPDAVLHKLRRLGLNVYETESGRLDDIPSSIEQLGRLAGTQAVAEKAAARFRQRLAALRARHAARPPVPVFYQVWHQPLMTVGGSQIISEAIRLCGGENVFAGLAGMAPTVSVEAVLAADPEAVVASGMGRDTPIGLEDWRRWTRLKAAARGNLFFVPADLMQRPTPRLLDGAEQLCWHLETARGRR